MKKNTPSLEKWLAIATDTKAKNEEYHRVHSNLATDGIRVHRDNALPACDCEFCRDRVSQVFRLMRPKATVTVSRETLVNACNLAIAIGKADRPSRDFIPPLRLSFNGKMAYRATCEGNGEISGEWDESEFESRRKWDLPVASSYRLGKGMTAYRTYRVTYRHEGENVEIALDPKLLKETLSGMGQTVTLELTVRNAPVHITSGSREAVLMPIYLG